MSHTGNTNASAAWLLLSEISAFKPKLNHTKIIECFNEHMSEGKYAKYAHKRMLSILLSIKPASSRSNTELIRDDPYWISWKNSLKQLQLSSINKVSLV